MLSSEIELRPAYVSIFSHNGIFTVKSLATGAHRTFKVRTQPADSNFAPGKRVLYLLTGPDNTNDYTGIGFIEAGIIRVWSRQQCHAPLARMLERLEAHEAAGRVEVYVSTRCRVCNRTLTTPESIRSGIGPICEERV